MNLERFQMLLRAENVGETTIYNYMGIARQFLKFLQHKNLDATVDNAYVYLSKFENRRTRNRYGTALKKFFLLTNLPGATRFRVPKNKTAKLPDILTEQEVLRLASACDNIRDRALILVTYDSTRRNSEVRNLRIRDVKFDKYGAEARFRSTKTEDANIRLIMSAPSLQMWLEHHRDRGNPDAYVFYGRNNQMTAVRFRQVLNEAAFKARLGRHVWPHLLRHSRIAALKREKKLSDDDIMNISGHTDRKMLDRYGKITMPMTNERLLEIHGLKQLEAKEQLAKARVCPRCRFLNSPLSEFCGKCGMVLDVKAAQSLMKREARVNEMLELLSDPEVKAKLLGKG